MGDAHPEKVSWAKCPPSGTCPLCGFHPLCVGSVSGWPRLEAPLRSLLPRVFSCEEGCPGLPLERGPSLARCTVRSPGSSRSAKVRSRYELRLGAVRPPPVCREAVQFSLRRTRGSGGRPGVATGHLKRHRHYLYARLQTSLKSGKRSSSWASSSPQATCWLDVILADGLLFLNGLLISVHCMLCMCDVWKRLSWRGKLPLCVCPPIKAPVILSIVAVDEPLRMVVGGLAPT